MPNPEGGTYAPFFNYVNGEYEAFVFSLDGDTATSAAASGTLNGGGTNAARQAYMPSFSAPSYSVLKVTYPSAVYAR